MSDNGHRRRILESFTKQVDSYSQSPIIAAEETRRKFIEFVNPSSSDRVLDVATGPGFLAFLFAEKAATVTGIDITSAMLQHAEEKRLQNNILNVRFQMGDAESIPFPDETFDIVTCGSAFHHFANPMRVLKEMTRVTKPKGKVSLSDTITSDRWKKAAFHNRLEQQRDPSHIRNLPLPELVRMFGEAGLFDIRTFTYETQRELNEWFAISKTPSDAAEKVKKAFIDSIPDDKTGLKVRIENGGVLFTHTSAWIVGTKKIKKD